MYKSVIEIRRDVPKEMIQKMSCIADEAFNNRAGKVRNMSKTPYCLSYEGGESDYGCLELGMLALENQKDFLACVEAWNWIDEECPDENCDILAEMKIPIR